MDWTAWTNSIVNIMVKAARNAYQFSFTAGNAFNLGVQVVTKQISDYLSRMQVPQTTLFKLSSSDSIVSFSFMFFVKHGIRE
jgi:hypothetical protein